MSSSRKTAIVSIILFFCVAFLLAGFQTAFWPHLLSFLPAPLAWLMVITYLAVYRNTVEGFISIYLIGLGLSVFTIAPTGILLLIISIIFFTIRFVRARIFWSGPSYYVLVSGVSVPFFNILHTVISWIFETNPVSHIPYFSYFEQALISPIFALVIYYLFTALDRLTRDEEEEKVDRWSTLNE